MKPTQYHQLPVSPKTVRLVGPRAAHEVGAANRKALARARTFAITALILLSCVLTGKSVAAAGLYPLASDWRPAKLNGSEDSIADIKADTNSLYVLTQHGFHILDVSDPSNPVLRGSLRQEWPVRNDRLHLKVKDNVAFVVTGNDRFYTIDVSDPTRPGILGSASQSGSQYRWVEADGDYCYVLTGTSTLQSYYVGDPRAPKRAFSGSFGTAVNFWIFDGKGYLLDVRNTSAGTGNLSVIDISDPTKLRRSAFYPTALATAAYVSGNYLFLSGKSPLSGLQVVDLSATPFVVSTMSTSGSAADIGGSGTSVVVLSDGVGLDVFDVTKPNNPQSTAKVAVPGATSLTVRDQFVYVNCKDRVVFLTSSEPTDPTDPPTNPTPTESDLNGDGYSDLLLQDDAGNIGLWSMNGVTKAAEASFTPNNVGDPQWTLIGSADFSGDGKLSLLFRHARGDLATWAMSGTTLQPNGAALLNPPSTGPDWQVVGLGDINGDQRADLLFQHRDGWLAVWYMDGTAATAHSFLSPSHPGDAAWHVVGTGDFNHDGKRDLLFQHEDGTVAVWLMDGTTLTSAHLLSPANAGSASWRVVAVTDLDQDGQPDIVFQNRDDHSLVAWLMDGISARTRTPVQPSVSDAGWKVVGPK